MCVKQENEDLGLVVNERAGRRCVPKGAAFLAWLTSFAHLVCELGVLDNFSDSVFFDNESHRFRFTLTLDGFDGGLQIIFACVSKENWVQDLADGVIDSDYLKVREALNRILHV